MIIYFFVNAIVGKVFGVNSGVKEQKMARNDKKLSVTLHISGSIHHMIVIYGVHMYNDGISRFFFQLFKILIFQVVTSVKGQKMA